MTGSRAAISTAIGTPPSELRGRRTYETLDHDLHCFVPPAGRGGPRRHDLEAHRSPGVSTAVASSLAAIRTRSSRWSSSDETGQPHGSQQTRVFVTASRGLRRACRPYSRGPEDRLEPTDRSAPFHGRFLARGGRPSEQSPRCRPPFARRARRRRPPWAGLQGPRAAGRTTRPTPAIPARARAPREANPRNGETWPSVSPPQAVARWRPVWAAQGRSDSVGPWRPVWVGRCRPVPLPRSAGHWSLWVWCWHHEQGCWFLRGKCWSLWTWRRPLGEECSSRVAWRSAHRHRGVAPISCSLGRPPRVSRWTGGPAGEYRCAPVESRRPPAFR